MNKFRNVKNRCFQVNGESFWVSRSVALIGLISASVSADREYVLISQRGTGTPDPHFVGWWNLVCGYLDWNESAREGLLREAWEETGLDLLACEQQGWCQVSEQPMLVQSDPTKDARQNISLVFKVVLSVPNLPTLSTDYADPDEVSAVKWLPLQRERVDELNFAFGHGDLIRRYLLR
jgi:ADP-ribose pyrophosphatase YjhB (NUDIX family)